MKCGLAYQSLELHEVVRLRISRAWSNSTMRLLEFGLNLDAIVTVQYSMIQDKENRHTCKYKYVCVRACF